MSHVRLFEHPANRSTFGAGVPKLYIAGALANAAPALAYEGRLSIVNLGQATAQVISVAGSLPPGATVTVDNAADQVVVAWPAYQASAAPIPNADFEQGDQQWIKGPGWSIVQNDVNDDPNTPTSAWAAKYANQGGNVELRNAVRVPVTLGQAIAASCRVQQGASSAGNAGAAVRLFFQPASGAEVMREGNLVDSGSNSEWKTSTLNTTSPVTGTVQIGCRGKRHRQNKPLWVDNFAWNATQPSVGTNAEGTIGPITIRIRDTLGREAEWTGSITVVDPTAALALLGKLVAWYDFEDNTNDGWGAFPLTQNGAGGYVAASTYGPGPGGKCINSGVPRSYSVFPPLGSADDVGFGAFVAATAFVNGPIIGLGEVIANGESIYVAESPDPGGGFIAQSREGVSNIYQTLPHGSVGAWHLDVAERRASGALHFHYDGELSVKTFAGAATVRDTQVVQYGGLTGDTAKGAVAFAFAYRGQLTAAEAAYLWNNGAGRTIAGIIADAGYTPPAYGFSTASATGIAISYNKRMLARTAPGAVDTGSGITPLRTGKRWIALRLHRIADRLDVNVFSSGGGSALFRYNGFSNNFVAESGCSPGTTPTFPTLVGQDVLMIAWDHATGKVWYGKNGAWSGDPAAGTGHAFLFTSSAGGFQVLGEAGGNIAFEGCFVSADMPYASPAGFTPAGD